MLESTHFEINLVPTCPITPVIQLINPQYMVDRDSQSDFTIQADLRTVIHGHLCPGGDPATLIVAEFRFFCRNNTRRFRNASIELLFADSFKSTEDGLCDPEVVAIAPAGKKSLNLTREQRTSKLTAGASVGAGSGGHASLGGNVEWEVTVSLEREFQATVTGAVRLVGRNYGKKNQAKWDLLENPSRGDGIPSLLRAVVLLKRSNDNGVLATIGIKVKVDLLHSMYSKFQDFMGMKPKDDPAFFMPGLQPLGGVPEGMDVENLSVYDLEKLCAVESATPIGGK